MSEASIRSGWVLKEMTAALAKEDQLRRRILIPLLIDRSTPPLQVADRIYANFQDSYLTSFERLVSKLHAAGLDNAPAPLEKFVVPLRFEQGSYLDARMLRKRLADLLPRLAPERRIEPRDFYVCNDEEYISLKTRFSRRLENIKTDSFYSPEFALSFASYYREWLSLEGKYLQGMCLILNELMLIRTQTYCDPIEAAMWFSRLWRGEILYRLWNSQNPNDPAIVEYGRNGGNDRLGYKASSFDVAVVGGLDVGPSEHGDFLEGSFRVNIDQDEELFKDTKVHGYCVLTKLTHYGGGIISKYVVPQMTAQIVDGVTGPYSWTFDNYFAGRS